MKTLQIAVLPGDGIGKEVMPFCVELVKEVTRKTGGYQLEFMNLEAGAELYQRTGDDFPEETFKAAAEADAILLGAMGLPAVRYPDGREIAPQLELRERLDLYAGVRPVEVFPGLPPVLANPKGQDVNFVIVRESTEGLFSSRKKIDREGDQLARDTMLITRPVSERLFDFAFRLARKRKTQGTAGRVTCVDKANVLGSMAFFRGIFDERAVNFTDITADHSYVDAMALNLVKHPWNYDVLVTENMFGDILSDQAAALVGGMGMAPSGDIGDDHAVFQPSHGSAPDIAGTGKANPTAMFLSAVIMFDWLSDQYHVPEAEQGARLLDAAIKAAYVTGDLLPCELGGNSGIKDIFEAVMKQLQSS